MEWINANDAVPPDDRDVLAVSFYSFKNVRGEKIECVEIHIAQRIVFRNGNIKWRCSKGSGFISTNKSETIITHWAKLPELPK